MSRHSLTVGPDLKARLDYGRHVAVEYNRDAKEVRYLTFSPSGLQRSVLPAAEFDRLFARRLDKPIGSVALDLLRLTQSAYLPGDGVLDTLMEIYVMSTTEGKMDLAALDMKALTSHYNGLAKAIGRPEVKGFKSKGEAIKRIEAVSATAKEPTPDQKQHAAAAAEKADKGLRALKAVAEHVTKVPKAKKAKEVAA